MLLLLVNNDNINYLTRLPVQQQVHPCAAAARSCAAAGTSVRRSSSFVRSSRYIRAPQQLVRAQQQVHPCTAAARSCAAAGTSVRQHNFSYFRAQQQVHSCDSTTFHISVRSSRYIRATAQLFIFPCAAAGTFVRQHNFSYFRAQQQVHPCAAAARSCAAEFSFWATVHNCYDYLPLNSIPLCALYQGCPGYIN